MDTSENVTITVEEDQTVNSGKSKKGLFLGIIAVLILIIAAILAYMFLIKDKQNGKYFGSNTYYECTPTSNVDGPMTYYIEFEKNGKYVQVLTMPTFIEAGTYEITGNKIVFNREFTKRNDDAVEKSADTIEKKYKNEKIVTDGYSCKKITKKAYKDWADSRSIFTYDEIKKEYENPTIKPDEPSDKETLELLGFKDADVEAHGIKYNISYLADYYNDTTIGTVDVTIKNAEPKVIFTGNVYSLSNEEIRSFMVNSDGTISTLTSEESDDPQVWYINVYDNKGNKVNTKEITFDEIATYFKSDAAVYYYGPDGVVNNYIN